MFLKLNVPAGDTGFIFTPQGSGRAAAYDRLNCTYHTILLCSEAASRFADVNIVPYGTFEKSKPKLKLLTDLFIYKNSGWD